MGLGKIERVLVKEQSGERGHYKVFLDGTMLKNFPFRDTDTFVAQSAASTAFQDGIEMGISLMAEQF